VNIIPVCSITDENLPFAMAAMMVSALENAASTTFYKFHCFISGKVSTDDRKKLLSIADSYKNCSIELIDMGNLYLDLPGTHLYVTNVCLYKISIIRKLIQYDRVLYLDSDIIVRQDLCRLYNYDLKGNYVGAVLSINKCMDRPDLAEHIDIPDMKTYFNAGLMLMNLKKMREDDLADELESHAGCFSGSVDQSIFNHVCYDKVLSLPPMYNVTYNNFRIYKTKRAQRFYSAGELSDAVNSPAVFHYAIAEKPWDYYGMIFGKEWDGYYKKSPYGDIKRRKKTFMIPLAKGKIRKSKIYYLPGVIAARLANAFNADK
jgi:UDP-glucose:(galactosyl)LPS alpha-1,2-glucosyltransferase